ncbi:MAG: choice-of-anchor D domain-containing protein [Candidatus Kapabacteria bacterium]|nr:choice-of-anchor D domain-containing protein [Candidatus Kapabacteria bacterium]
MRWLGHGVLWAASAIAVLAQPQVAYMVPDIGAPGMAVAVEIVAYHSAVGTLGPDGVYSNNPGDALRVECARPADTALLTIGPVVVSWQGRLLSTVIFVHPWVQPNSWRWDELRPEFRVPIRVTYNGRSTIVDTFYVVRPTPVGVYTGTERVLGEGGLGIRSRRGALLVDSLVLPAGATFRVSVADCDPYTPGNQGYLPCVLMAVGSVRGSGGTTISVSAEGPNAGPGGGGGGGAFCDVLTGTARGSDGGNGFTSGGRGGKNGIGVGLNEYRNYGQSTGENGASLNGVPPGTSPQYESAGGGTGHPFGRSGEGCRDGGSCNPSGGYGGGSGYQQRQAGGAGGYAVRGQSSGGNNGGYEHGNACLVPLAGGSGGASGNPQGVNVCSGTGGGGGGALCVVAPSIQGVRFTADGAPGALTGSSAAGPGGGGSGGAIHLCAPRGFSDVAISVAGGAVTGAPAGGAGRVRLDGRASTTVLTTPAAATRFVGPSIFPPPPQPRQAARVNGTGNGNDIVLYRRSLRGTWEPVDTLTGYGEQWSASLSLPEPDTLFFLVALQRIPNPSSAQYAAEPSWVLSPSSACLVTVARLPRLVAPAVRQLDTALCVGQEVWDTVRIVNAGEGPIELTAAFFARGDQGFRLVAPPAGWFPRTLAPRDTVRLIVAFQALAVGVFRDTLILVHTDTLVSGSPWRILYQGVRDSLSFLLTDGAAPVRRLDFGTLCPGEQRTARIVIRNTGRRPLQFAPPWVSNAAQWDVSPPSGFTIAPGEQRVVDVHARMSSIGVVRGFLVVSAYECSQADTVELSAYGLQTRLEWHGSGQFGFVRVGSTSELTVTLRNVGYSAARIPRISPLPAPFEIVEVQPVVPVLLAPQQELRVRIRYAPTTLGNHVAELVVMAERADSACPDTARLLLSGTGIRVGARAQPSVVDFGVVSHCESPLDTIWVVNIGSAPLELLRPAQVVGPHAADFVVVVQPSLPYRLAPGDSVAYGVQLLPGAQTGVRSAQVVLVTDDTVEPYVTVSLRAERVSPFVAVPAAISLGTLRQGQTVQMLLQGRNLLLRPLRVEAVLSSHPDVSVSPTSAVILASGSYDFTVTVTPQRLGVLEAEVAFALAELCPDTHRVRLYGTVTGEGVAYSPLLDFGTVAFCQERSDTLVLSNATADTLWLLEAVLLGPDAAVFITELPPLPIRLQPRGHARYAIHFRPQRTTDGDKSAQLRLTARLGVEMLQLTVTLRGRRETPILSAPPQVHFGGVFAGATSQQPLVVGNRGAFPLRVESIGLQQGSAFQLLAAPMVPRVVAPSESLNFIIGFRPQQPGVYTDTLRLSISQPCTDERLIAITGIGLEPVRARVWLPDTQATPWTQGFRIPLRFAIEPPGAQTGVRQAEVELAYEPTLFLVRGLSRGTILRQGMAQGLATLTIRVEGIQAASQGVVTELIGDVLLGSAEETPLRILSFLWDDGVLSSQTQRIDGRLRLVGICREGGPRLLRPVAPVGLRTTASAGELTVETWAGERGAYVLGLYSLEGRRLEQRQWYEDSAGSHEHVWHFRIGAPGAYVVLFRTPSEVRSALVLVP